MIDTDTIEGKIEVMAAFAAGKTIESRALGVEDEWEPLRMPPWNWLNFDYRIAPEPLEFHVVVDRSDKWVYAYVGVEWASILAKDQDERYRNNAPHRVVLVREVLP